MTHVVFGLNSCETRVSDHIGISPAGEGWTVANGNMMCPVDALTCIEFLKWSIEPILHQHAIKPMQMHANRRFSHQSDEPNSEPSRVCTVMFICVCPLGGHAKVPRWSLHRLPDIISGQHSGPAVWVGVGRTNALV
jgi:hypothetical protein